MDFRTLEQVMKNDLLDMKVNKYDVNHSGTIKLAEHHLGNLKECTYDRPSETVIEMYYKGKSFGSIQGQTPSTNSLTAVRTANNKMKAEEMLTEHNLKTTQSILIEEDDYTLAESLVEESKLPMVLKPYNLNAGRGITLNIDASNLAFAWNQAKEAYGKTNKKFKVLLQPILPGIETRLLVIEGKFNSAVLRVPSNVTGDGKSSIKELVEQKNIERNSNPHLKRLPLKINETVKYNINRNGFTTSSTPEVGEVVFLHSSSNISLGGDSYEVTHLINDKMKRTAELAVQAIPELNTAGVDLLFKSFDDKDPAILEVNPGANLRMHHYPWKGTPKTPVFDLIDEMFMKYKRK